MAAAAAAAAAAGVGVTHVGKVRVAQHAKASGDSPASRTNNSGVTQTVRDVNRVSRTLSGFLRQSVLFPLGFNVASTLASGESLH